MSRTQSKAPQREAGPGVEMELLDVDGRSVRYSVSSSGDWLYVNELLRARDVVVEGGSGPVELRLVTVLDELGPAVRERALELLDNEVTAGLRLGRLAGRAAPTVGFAHPPFLSRLVGYQPVGERPVVALERPRGTPISGLVGRMPLAQRQAFNVSLVRALRWMTAAGVVHRNLNPSTVLWSDDHGAQIVDFSQSTLIGVPRVPTGREPWAPQEQRDSWRGPRGVTSERDDVWAMARLIAVVFTGDNPSPQSLDAAGLSDFLSDAFSAPESRPSLITLLERLREPDPLARVRHTDPRLEEGRRQFDEDFGADMLEIGVVRSSRSDHLGPPAGSRSVATRQAAPASPTPPPQPASPGARSWRSWFRRGHRA